MKSITSFLILSLFLGALPGHSQDLEEIFPSATPFNVTVKEISYLSAKGAQLLNKDNETIVVAEEFSKKLQGALIEITDQPNKFIEVFNLITIDGRTFASYPPKVEVPLKESTEDKNIYLVTGKPCEKLGVAVRSDEAPVWLEVNLGGCDEPDPVDPVDPPDSPDPVDPPTDLIAEVKKVVADGVKSLKDPVTQSLLAVEVEKVVPSPQESAEDYYAKVQAAMSKALLESTAPLPYKDWFGKVRKPVHDLIRDKELSAAQLHEVMKAFVETLKTTASRPSLSSTTNVIEVYSRDDCPPCRRWKEQVLPLFTPELGWTIKEYYYTGTVPKFIIRTKGKVFTYTGYMSIQTFESIIAGA